MILFFSNGRLGNQIFQYCFIRSVENNDQLLITYNFEDILQVFDKIDNVINIRNKYIKFFIKIVVLFMLDILAQLKLITSYKINEINDNGFIVPDITFVKKDGLIPVIFIYPCFAQSESFFMPEITDSLTIKKIYIEKAEEFIASVPSNCNKIFVHIRRGDYLNYSVLGKIGAALPISYYNNCIEWYENNIDKPFFIFLTDDPEFVQFSFERINRKLISDNNLFVDFSIITLCEYGILSNSSFSWWAAYMMKNKKKILSPKYWLGWKSQKEFPKGITPSFVGIAEMEVEIT